MKKNFTFGIIIFVVILILLASCRRRESQEQEKAQNWKTLITSDVENERKSARRSIQDIRKDTIEHLLSVVNTQVKEGEEFYNSVTSRNIAISLLGKLRAKEVVADLTKWLSPKPGQLLIFGDFESYLFSPAGYALIEIGLPSVPPLVELVKSEGTTALGEQCIKIIVSIKGLPETELVFEDMLVKETDNSKRENLKSAQDLLKNPKFRKILENI